MDTTGVDEPVEGLGGSPLFAALDPQAQAELRAQMVEVRLADLRAAGARAALIASARVGPRGVGPAVGGALIRLGRWLAPGEGSVAAPNAGVRVAR